MPAHVGPSTLFIESRFLVEKPLCTFSESGLPAHVGPSTLFIESRFLQSDLDQRKAKLRREMRALRKGLDGSGAAAALARTFPADLLAGARVVAGYHATSGEIDPAPLLAALRARGLAIALPRVAAKGQAPVFHLWTPGDDLAADAYGVPSPAASAAEARPDVMLVPLLAFDRAGRRLGQGGGIYDRALAALKPRGTLAAGLAFAAQEVDEIPAGELDQMLDWIVTEREAIKV